LPKRLTHDSLYIKAIHNSKLTRKHSESADLHKGWAATFSKGAPWQCDGLWPIGNNLWKFHWNAPITYKYVMPNIAFCPPNGKKSLIKILDQNADLDLSRNLISWSLSECRPIQIFHKNRSSNFLIMLLTDRQTDRQNQHRGKHNLLNGGDNVFFDRDYITYVDGLDSKWDHTIGYPSMVYIGQQTQCKRVSWHSASNGLS